MTDKFHNKFTGEELTTYPTIFASLSKQTHKAKSPEKLEQQRDKFSSRYVCPICKQPKTWVEDTNIMVCTNESCPGIRIKDQIGNVIKIIPPFSRLNHKGFDIANELYGGKE